MVLKLGFWLGVRCPFLNLSRSHFLPSLNVRIHVKEEGSYRKVNQDTAFIYNLNYKDKLQLQPVVEPRLHFQCWKDSSEDPFSIEGWLDFANCIIKKEKHFFILS